jgi:hypothetical protein
MGDLNMKAPPPPLAPNVDGMNNSNALIAAGNGIQDGDNGMFAVDHPSTFFKRLGRSLNSFKLFSVLAYLWLAILWCCRFYRFHPPPHVENNLNEVNVHHVHDGNDEDEDEDEAEDVDSVDDDDSESTASSESTANADNSESTTGSEWANFSVYPVHRCIKRVDKSVLKTVVLPEGLECIGDFAFNSCNLLSRINIPSSVKVIGMHAFSNCRSLESVELPDRLEVLGLAAFWVCTSLRSINLPPRVKRIQLGTFKECMALQNVDLPEGLEFIEDDVFEACPLLRHIEIPSTVKNICLRAFGDIRSRARNLDRVQFCDDIEEFVSGESIRDWWNNGVSEHSLKTYNFLVRCNIPSRLEQLIARQWQASIHDMLRGIPLVDFVSVDFFALDDYFTTIESKLAFYELHNATTVLELAIWKSKILEQYGQGMDNVRAMEKLQCRVECGACVIIPHVLPFL